MDWRQWFKQIASDKELTSETLRVLLVIIATLDDSFAQISQVEIAKEIGIKREQAARAIRRLVQKGIITKELRGGKLVGYRIVDTYTKEKFSV